MLHLQLVQLPQNASRHEHEHMGDNGARMEKKQNPAYNITLNIIHFCVSLLTYNGENNHHKVKDVPCNCEEIATQSNDLNQAFSGEDHDEDQVDLVEDGLHAF